MIPRDEIANFEHHTANAADLWRGIIGSSFTLGSFTVSQMETLEAWLRIISLLVGIAVGVATLWSIYRRNSRAK